MHRRTVEAAAGADRACTSNFRMPFETIIPNAAAIAEATEPDRRPKSFTAKYTSPFAKLYRSLCEEIVKRSQWQAYQGNGAKVTITAGTPTQ